MTMGALLLSVRCIYNLVEALQTYLHDKVRSECAYACYANTWLCRSICCPDTCSDRFQQLSPNQLHPEGSSHIRISSRRSSTWCEPDICLSELDDLRRKQYHSKLVLADTGEYITTNIMSHSPGPQTEQILGLILNPPYWSSPTRRMFNRCWNGEQE